MITIHYNAALPRSSARNSMRDAMSIKDEGQTVCTSCDLFMLVLMQRVRYGGVSEIQFTFEDRPGLVVQVDTNGDLIQSWPDNLFELRFYLQFSRNLEELTDIVTQTENA